MEKSNISGAAFKALTRSTKEQMIRAFVLACVEVDPTTTSNGHARAAAAHFDAPFNTMRGLLHSAFEAHERPWLTVAGYDAPEVVEAVQAALAPAHVEPQPEPPAPVFMPDAPPALDDLDRFVEDVVEDAPKRKRGTQPGSQRAESYRLIDGRFVRIGDGPLHACPRCGREAFDHDDIIAHFGARIERKGTPRERHSFQSLCRACKTKARKAERHRKRDDAKAGRLADIIDRRTTRNRKVYGDAQPPNTRPPQPG